MEIRSVQAGDLDDVVAIYNEGIDDRIATFETDHRSAGDLMKWINSGLPFLVLTDKGAVRAFAVGLPYSDRCAYAGVIDFSVYVRRECRGRGYGRAVMEEFLNVAKDRGFHKVVGKLLGANEASFKMLKAVGFREVGVHLRHGQLDGEWHDVRVVERLL